MSYASISVSLLLLVGVLSGCGAPPSLFELTEKAAAEGDAVAQYNFALMNNFGNGVEQNTGAAVEWFKKAADQGHTEAQYHLAKAYETGNGTAADPGEAVKWYELAAKEGNAEAQFALGKLLDPADPDADGAQWFRAAAEQDHAAAQYRLGRLYRENARGPDDYVEAYFWLRLAADFDDRAYKVLEEMVAFQRDEDGEFIIGRFQIKEAKAKIKAWLEARSQ